MRYTVRKIEKKDDREIEKIIRACLTEFGANRVGTAWTDPDLGRFSEIYNTAGARYYVAEDETGRLVGGAGVGGLDGAEGVCELQKMYCLPEVRGAGAARELMNAVLKYAAEYYDACYLETLDNMKAAQKFYEKYGFQRIDRPLGKTAHFACDVRYMKILK